VGEEQEPLDLPTLATEICRRYRLEFPDEDGRYGEAGNAWCVHDNQYLLHWAADAVAGYLDMSQEVSWLASVLEARDFPLDRLARDLEIGAEVALSDIGGSTGQQLARVLAEAAGFVRSRRTFLDQ
jgi:hypothetical protein